jgi:uncharacterized membrane protein YidH (DUF202 family)
MTTPTTPGGSGTGTGEDCSTDGIGTGPGGTGTGGRHTDPGLAAERTELAWTRTAISFAAVGGALLKNHSPAGIGVLALSLLIWELGHLRGKPATGHARTRRLQLTAAAVTAIALTALAITLATGW